jgi:TatD DNase family protein
MKEVGVWTTVIGTSLKDSQDAVAIVENHEGIFACVGIHPVDDPTANFDVEEFEKLVSHPKVVAVGECGLDYFRTDPNDEGEKDRQRDLFKKQIEFALRYNKPLMIHSRSAYDELADILELYKKTNPELVGNIHFFSGNLDQAKRFIDLGFTLSFAGPVTFAREYDEVIRSVPTASILSETDAPFATPLPFRGKRNEPSYVVHVADKLAEIRGENTTDFRKKLVENALRLFKIGL